MTGCVTFGAGPHTGPPTLKAPGGSGATIVPLPVAGSRTPTPLSVTYAMRPWGMPAPATVGDGEIVAAGLPLQAATRRSASAGRNRGMRRRDGTGTLLPNGRPAV